MSFLSFFCLSKTENGSVSCVPTAQQNKSLASVKDARLSFLVRETGLEPVRDYHTPLKRARLPIPPLSHILFCCFRNGDNYSKGSPFCQAVFANYGAGFLSRLCGRLFEKQSAVIRHPPYHQNPEARSGQHQRCGTAPQAQYP